MRITLTALALLLVVSAKAGAQDAGSAPEPTIASVGDGLYEVSNGKQHTLFAVADEGIILADPLSRDTALWLKDELEARFPQHPVRFVLHTYHFIERSEGASVFNDTAELVGHRTFEQELSRARQIEAERYRFARSVESIYDSSRQVVLGRERVVLTHIAQADAPEMTLLYFARQKVLFAVNPPLVTTVPFTFGGFSPREVFDWLQAATSFDFERVLFGNGESLPRDQLATLAEYLNDLRAAVEHEVEKGSTLTETLAAIARKPASPHDSSRTSQITDLYRRQRSVSAEVTFAGVTRYSPDSTYCEKYDSCYTGGATGGGLAAFSMQFRNGVGLAGELTMGMQMWSSRTKATYEEEVAVRLSRAAILFRYAPPRPRALPIAVVAGVGATRGDGRGVFRNRGALLPLGGLHAIEETATEFGPTVGVEISKHVAGGLTFVVPVRVTIVPDSAPAYWPHGSMVEAGLGIRMRVLKRAY
jgi:hypothetical protein